jgi:hypothetical protein
MKKTSVTKVFATNGSYERTSGRLDLMCTDSRTCAFEQPIHADAIVFLAALDILKVEIQEKGGVKK